METEVLCILNGMKFLYPFILMVIFSCSNETQPKLSAQETKQIVPEKENKPDIRTVHVFVALCDNKYQGIVPVGKAIGNGQDPVNNLYWGCDNGIKTYFKKKNSDWHLIQTLKKVSDTILERLLFKHKTKNVFLLADAYDGRFIKQTTIDFLNASSGKNETAISHNKDTLYFGGASNLLSYIGHDGLMDFSLPVQEQSKDTMKREAIILACYSQYYFAPHIKAAGASPLVWTTGLMAPEAYTLHDALNKWVANETIDEIRMAAAQAYSKFQKCSIKAARNLLVSGW